MGVVYFGPYKTKLDKCLPVLKNNAAKPTE